MNLNEQFDELARRKLEERAYPFEESAWLDAQRAIAARKGRRRRWGWYLGGLLAAVGMAWILGGEPWAREHSRTVVSGSAAAGAAGQPAAAGNAEMEGGATSRETEAAAPIERADRASSLGGDAAAPDTPRAPSVTGSHHHDATAPFAAANPMLPVNPAIGRAAAEPAAHAPADRTADTGDGGIVPEPVGSGLRDAGLPPGRRFEPNPELSSALALSGDEPGVLRSALGEDASASLIGLRSEDASRSEGAERTAIPMLLGISASLAPALPHTVEPGPVIQPLRISRWSWEVGALAGGFSATSDYRGNAASDWSVSPQLSVGVGAEAMRMNRNLGIGFGLHHGSFADRLSTPEAIRTTIELDRYWYLTPVDTTLLVITDSAFNGEGQMEYYGFNVPATVMVIRSAYDTTATRLVIRQARQRVNRTSYIELPLLLDAHAVQGRWSIGVRGGPSIGLLTRRDISLPAEEGDGYADADPAAVRQWVLGWTARAYVRYRFNSAWSIGLEPALRGQFMDAVVQEGVARRSTAGGFVLSLSYRLP